MSAQHRRTYSAIYEIALASSFTVPPLTVAALGTDFSLARSELPSFWALFRRGQLRWTVIGAWTFGIDQGAVSTSFGIAILAFMATIPGKAFTAYLMEIIGRRWDDSLRSPRLHSRPLADGNGAFGRRSRAGADDGRRIVDRLHDAFLFSGTILVAVIAGAFAPLLFGKETVGQIEVIAAEAAPEPA
jgi:hypothetical protein